MLSICAISDLHGYLPKIEPCELLLICGDIVNLKCQQYHQSCKKWYIKNFKPWIEGLPCEKVLFIPGNHECGVEGHEIEYRNMFPHSYKATILIHEEYEYLSNEGKIYKIFGTPYCKIFGNWAYMRDNDTLKEKFSEIPEELDILMTHDAPYGCNDVCVDSTSWNTFEHLGNIPLREIVLEKKPKLLLHGHLHSSLHEFESLGESKVINCSIKNENYEPTYSPLLLDI